ncbi:MAG: YadA C-terminal domain-containing protein, partial [Fusobacterium sp.]|nr:YadA C-terminal domain-containing protein [Fusobacterium sp.]
FAQYDGRLSGLEKKVDNLDDKMNKGMSLMAAMNAVDFQNVQSGEMAIGAGIGHYGNAQSVAVGVAYAPTEDVSLNAKYSITAGDVDSFAVGAGASYKFKVGR